MVHRNHITPLQMQWPCLCLETEIKSFEVVLNLRKERISTGQKISLRKSCYFFRILFIHVSKTQKKDLIESNKIICLKDFL